MLLSDSRDQKDGCVSDLFKLPIIESGKNGGGNHFVDAWTYSGVRDVGVNSYSVSK